MTNIRVRRDSGGYRAWVEGNHDWCYGFGSTWERSVTNLLTCFEATLGIGLHIEPCVHSEPPPQPLDGMAASNAMEVP